MHDATMHQSCSLVEHDPEPTVQLNSTIEQYDWHRVHWIESSALVRYISTIGINYTAVSTATIPRPGADSQAEGGVGTLHDCSYI